MEFSPNVAKDINKLCVRLAFCLYAEDAGLFKYHSQFYKYLNQFATVGLNNALEKLFKVLDTKYDERSVNLPKELSEFPYVNGNLFTDSIEIPELDEEFRNILLNQASSGFDWKDISPTIFGAIFESTINPETRRAGGMHYTSIENIHKVIDPLFLNDLKAEFKKIKESKQENIRRANLINFQKKLGTLTFLDPACGSGNFLTETYLSLRKLENSVMRELYSVQIDGQQGYQTGFEFEDLDNSSTNYFNGNPTQVTIDQFYGIEINDYAVAVAQTAMWIAEAQMMKETSKIVGREINFLPLHNYENIHCANALRIDWNEVIPASNLNYIMGNPPFGGTKLQTKEQKKDMEIVFFNNEKYKKLDYVAAWYKKSADYLLDNDIKIAFVSTNSIVQGEMIDILWKQLFKDYGFHFDFAYKTFKWDSEAASKANVFCVILGCSKENNKLRSIYTVDKEGNVISEKKCKNINAYLMAAESVFIEKRQKTIGIHPQMTKGSQLIDGGNYVFESKEEYEKFLSKEPNSKKFFRRYFNSRNFLNDNSEQYCLFLDEASPSEIKELPLVKERVLKVKEFRQNSDAASVKAISNSPSKYFIANIPKKISLIVPIVSSEKRIYLPMKFSLNGAVYTNALNYIEDVTLYDFAIITSSSHMAWMRTVAGRLKSDYRYSKDIVYNTFVWPESTEIQKKELSNKAQAILDARNKYPDCSLSDLYDDELMPTELRKAHEDNDKAVLALYGLPSNASEEEIVAHLMNLYKERTQADSGKNETENKQKKETRRKKSTTNIDKIKTLTSKEKATSNVSKNESNIKEEIAPQSSNNHEDQKDNNNDNNKTPVQTTLFDLFE